MSSLRQKPTSRYLIYFVFVSFFLFRFKSNPKDKRRCRCKKKKIEEVLRVLRKSHMVTKLVSFFRYNLVGMVFCLQMRANEGKILIILDKDILVQ